MEFDNPSFVISAHSLQQLPESNLPEIAFAGRSNVGKSSLINALLNRKTLVKVSGRPGKTQGLNYFLVSEKYHFVDLPGYGYAKVSKSLKAQWGALISSYLESRQQLSCVVVIMDLRHGAKLLDSELLRWLKAKRLPFLAVYTKADKLSGNARQTNARILDAGHNIRKHDRVIFSATTKIGRQELIDQLLAFAQNHP